MLQCCRGESRRTEAIEATHHSSLMLRCIVAYVMSFQASLWESESATSRLVMGPRRPLCFNVLASLLAARCNSLLRRAVSALSAWAGDGSCDDAGSGRLGLVVL